MLVAGCATTGTTGNGGRGDAEKLLDRGLAAFEKGEMDKTIEQLEGFLGDDPAKEPKGRALFPLGMAYQRVHGHRI